MQLEAKNKPQREVIQITKVVPMYKPVKDHVHNVSITGIEITQVLESCHTIHKY